MLSMYASRLEERGIIQPCMVNDMRVSSPGSPSSRCAGIAVAQTYCMIRLDLAAMTCQCLLLA